MMMCVYISNSFEFTLKLKILRCNSSYRIFCETNVIWKWNTYTHLTAKEIHVYFTDWRKKSKSEMRWKGKGELNFLAW